MKLDRVGNAKRNIFYSLINKIVTLLFPFVIRTVLIKEIGAEFLGLNSLFASILQVLNLAELGFTSAVVFSMYKPIAEDDNETLCAILNFLRIIYLKISLVMLVAGLVIMPFIPHLIKGTCPEGINLYVLYAIYLLNTCLSYAFLSYKQTILTAYQRIDILNNINTVLFLFIYSMQLFIIYITHNVYLYAFSSIISTTIMNSLSAIIVNKKFPHLVCKGSLGNETKADIKQKVAGLMIGKVAGITRNAMDSIFLSAFLGLIETAIYNNYYLIMNTVIGFLLVIYSSIIAGVGNSVATETVEKNYNDLQIMNFIYMWLSGWFSICMLCLYQPFMELVFGKDMLFPMSTVVGFCCYFYVLKTGDIFSLYVEAIGAWWQFRYVSILEALLNIIFNFFLGKYFGAIGIIYATVFSMLLSTTTFGTLLGFKLYFKKQNFYLYFLKNILYFVVTLVVAIITFYITSKYNTISIKLFFVKMLICIIVPNILYFLIYRKYIIYKKAKIFIYNIIFRRKNA